jgi:predicted acetylornithine/succinylornithine family transaminase
VNGIIIEKTDRFIMETYNRFKPAFVKGKGTKLYDETGKEYTDFLAGIAVCNLGHSHPKITEQIVKQAGNYLHFSNLFYMEPQSKLAELLVKNSFADRVFFCNSGAEANEGAIKLARKYAKDNISKDKYEIITMLDSFHGRTFATISATGQEKVKKGFEPILPGFKYVRLNDMLQLKAAVTNKTCAVMLEPIQGEGGVKSADHSFMKELREFCSANKLLLIFDEIQTGVGRTGKMFAYEHYGVEPDIMTLAKGLANGLPLGAVLAKEEAAKSFVPGTHASTFGGNPVCCAAAVAALKTILDEDYLKKCTETGAYFREKLTGLKEKYSFIKEIRGEGLLIGLELDFPGADIVKKCFEKALIINCVMDRVLRFLPSFLISTDEIDMLIAALDEIFSGINVTS